MIGLSEPVSINGQCITLPSSEAAVKLVRGDVASGLAGVVGSTVLRGGLIMAGLYLAGERTHLVRNALGATLAIEAFVLAWVAVKNAQAAAPAKGGAS